ncbi:MAG: hypothetical protein HYV09_26430 [Deltaproteobacteria bacterium]|nr:hypothetical protein [Deltaproteobacteria bacterium]
MVRRSWIRTVALGVLVALGGCLAPTLPVPPPAQPEILGPDESGMVTLKGSRDSARPSAEVTVWNPNLDGGKGEGRTTIANPDGSWQETIPAAHKQTLWVWQTVGFERSAQIEVVIP